VMIDDPRGEAYYGGEVSAPVFAEIMESALRTLNIAPDASKINQLAIASSQGGF